MNRGEQTLRAVTGSGGRLHLGMVAGIKSEWWPTSNRNPWPDCLGIRTPARIFFCVPEWTGPFDVEVDCVAVTKD